MQIKKYRWKLREDVTLPTAFRHIIKVEKVSETLNEKGEVIDEEYELTVLEQ